MRITSLHLRGFRAFTDTTFNLSPLEVIAGANGTGKSCLFEFLNFLCDGAQREIPPQVIPGVVRHQVFNRDSEDHFQWNICFDNTLSYQGELLGPVGQIKIVSEMLQSILPKGEEAFVFLERAAANRGILREQSDQEAKEQGVGIGKVNQLILSVANNPELATIYDLREYTSSWRFYSGFNFAKNKIRRSIPVEQDPQLDEDCGNLSAILHYLMTEHRQIFDDLELLLRGIVPGFDYITVKARGGPGEVIAFWKEHGVNGELSLADLSDGTLRLLCWLVLCLHPYPPSLICVDEPDQGIHPRALAVLAGMFRKASQRTQVLLATHDSYFMTQFELNNIAIMRKEQGSIDFVKPANSQVILDLLEDFGTEQLAHMHRSDELEILP
jgi:predicted ATPase